MKKLLKILLVLLITSNLSYAFAWTVDNFKVEFNKKVTWVWEALDLTITALDKNDEIVTDYTGNVFGFSETDDSIEIPEELSNNDGYSFKLSDWWVKKFENWVKFNTSWEQSISIYDANDYENITWKWEINITKTETWNKTVEIEILSPESNTTLPRSELKVSWATKKNHQVKIKINNKQEFSTTSNSDWIFEKQIEWLITWNNVIKAFTLDADENIIGESSEVIINIDDNKPKFKSIKLSPISQDWRVEENTEVEVVVFANIWLKSVKLLFNDWVINLEETEEWKYSWIFKTPSEEREFSMDVVMVDTLGHTVTEKEVAKINVFLVEVNSALEETSTWVEVKNEEPKEEIKPELPNLEIKWLKLVKLKSKSILTWDKVDDAKSYDIFKKNKDTGKFEFLKNVDNPKFEVEITGEKVKYQYFAVKAKTQTNSWEIIVWDLSQATKIQTWPTEVILMLIISLIAWLFFITIAKRRKS